jgi:hypothetical protein
MQQADAAARAGAGRGSTALALAQQARTAQAKRDAHASPNQFVQEVRGRPSGDRDRVEEAQGASIMHARRQGRARVTVERPKHRPRPSPRERQQNAEQAQARAREAIQGGLTRRWPGPETWRARRRGGGGRRRAG